MQFTNLKYSMFFNTLTELCNYYGKLILEHFIAPHQKIKYQLVLTSNPLIPSAPGNH